VNQIQTLCVMGTFDNGANEAVRRMKHALKAQGISTDSYEPHITFGIYAGLDEESLITWTGSVAAQHKRIRILFNHFGFFPDARLCFLAPCSNFSLLELHASIHERYDECCLDKGCLYSLRKNNWVPHMSIASAEQGQEEKLLSSLWANFTPFTAEITQLKITASDRSKEIGVFELEPR